MSTINGVGFSYNSLFSARATAFETTLRQNLETFRELIVDVKEIQHELETCKTEITKLKDKCERKKCFSSEIYEKLLEKKNNLIELAVSTAITIDETKNLNLIGQLLKILCGDTESLTLESLDNKENVSQTILSTSNKKKLNTDAKSKDSPAKKKKSPKKEVNKSKEDVLLKDESVTEIEGTPGRTSPIIQPKKLKTSSSISSLSGTSTDSREKKKCPDSWDTPDPKQLKLCFPSPKRIGKGKISRQGRLSFVASKPSSIVDLTCSPELSGGTGTSQNSLGNSQNGNATSQNPSGNSQKPHIQILIKKESSDYEDFILASPTSGPDNIVLSKTTSKDSQKFKKPLSLLKVKTEEANETCSPIIQIVDKKVKDTTKEPASDALEESINILKPNRFARSPHKKTEKSPAKLKLSPPKVETSLNDHSPASHVKSVTFTQAAAAEPMDDDVTHCEGTSMSILQHVDKLEQAQKSPMKNPLAENQNVVNVPTDQECIPFIPQENGSDKVEKDSNNKRKFIEKVEPIYKEPTVRKKAEKMALPGWCCDECKDFYGDLYAQSPARAAAAVARCSKHRARRPPRARTPPGFWHPRWDVPHDTDEFNARNDAL